MSPEHTQATDIVEDSTPKFEKGQPVIVEARNRDKEGKPVGERVPQAGWEVRGTETTGENAGKVHVQKIEGSFVYDRYPSPESLAALQEKYEVVKTSEGLSVRERKEMGRASLNGVEVRDDPSDPPMWSKEWSKQQREPRRAESVADATAESPYYFPETRHAQYITTGSQVDVLGIYSAPDGNMLIVTDPLDPGSLDHILLTDVTMLADADKRAVEQQSATPEAQLQDLLEPIELGPTDIKELDSYTLALQMGSDLIVNQNLERMSSDAVRAIAGQYAAIRTKILQSGR